MTAAMGSAKRDGKTATELARLGGTRLVYVRAVTVGEVRDEIAAEDPALAGDLPDDGVVYSVHRANGERVALIGDRDVAFASARQHEMNPVSVH